MFCIAQYYRNKYERAAMSETVSKIAAEGIRDGLATLFGPAAREFGEYLSDKIRYHRYTVRPKKFWRGSIVRLVRPLEYRHTNFLSHFSSRHR